MFIRQYFLGFFFFHVNCGQEHVYRVRYVSRGRLLLRTPGPVQLWDLHVFWCRDQSLLDLSCFRTFEFRTSLGTSLFLIWLNQKCPTSTTLRLILTSHTEKNGRALYEQRNRLHLEILPCKWSCPLRPYMEKAGSSLGLPLIPISKKSTVDLAAHGLHIGILQCKWGCRIRPYMEIVGCSVGSPVIPILKKTIVEWAANGLYMGSLPCKWGCPLLPYMETVGSSVGNQFKLLI